DSLTIDPANASAHRFLSDSYLGIRRHEIARVSELLQAQLLQDININPVQPSISSTNLNVFTLGGPAAPGFNEFTPLFQRNQAQFNATGFGGNNDTYGGEAVVSGLYGPLSLSAGAFSYDTDGWRDNNDLDQDIYDFFVQWAVSPELNLQAEYGYRDQNYGDLVFDFDPDDFLANERNHLDDNFTRFGLRYSPTTRSTYLLSYISTEITEKIKDFDQLDPFTTFSLYSDTDTDGDLPEGQYLYEGERFNLTVGGSYTSPDMHIRENVTFADVDFGPFFEIDTSRKMEAEQKHAYVYTNITAMDAVTWTVGASYDDYQTGPSGNSDLFDETSFNPKLGVRWDVNDALQLRAAAFKVLKPTLVGNRTIEPTQVAGFNQLFDDAVGTKYWRYGLGADWHLSRNLVAGAEATWRNLDNEPITQVSLNEAGDVEVQIDTEDRRERRNNLYLNWTPLEQVAVTAKFVYDYFESKENGILAGVVPEKVDTYSLPVTAAYFNPDGFFATLGGTYVDQDVDGTMSEFGETSPDGDSRFFLVDAAVGYRLPKRRGVVSLGVSNLFDRDFDYLDDSYREHSPGVVTGPYYPDRIVMGRATLNF
ncbi:MAG: TonB-dependent receptor, partial [Gammaproteobacteria bacterium]